MSEKTQYVIELNDKLSPGLKKATAKAQGLDRAMGGIGGKAKKGGGAIGGLGASLGKLAGPLAIATAGLKAFQFASESIKASREFEALENSIVFASGSAQAGAENMDFLRERSNLLGSDLIASAEGFKTLSGAMMGSRLEGQATRDIFDSIQVASSVMGLDAEQAKGAMLALGQIMGKGKVQAEELRGQLGERIPGAFGIASRAMGMTTQELDKAMSNGEIMAEDFLPKFANELKNTFGGGLEKSVNSSQANMNRFNNSMLELKLTLGTVLMPVVNQFMGLVSKAFEFIKLNAGVIREALSPLFDAFARIRDVVSDFVGRLFGGADAGNMLQNVFTGLQKVLLFFEPILNIIIDVWAEVFNTIIKVKDAFDSLTTRFPIIGKIFKGLVYGIRGGIIQIYKTAKNLLGGVGDLLAGIFSGDVDQIKKGVAGLAKAFDPTANGRAVASGFMEGFETEGKKAPPLKLQMVPEKKTSNFSDLLKQQSLLTATGGGGTGTGNGVKKSSTKVDSVKSGRPTNIYINIGKMIEQFNVTATNLDDINKKAQDLVAQALLTAVNNANLIAK